MEDVLDTIRKLIRLTASPFRPEADAAAYRACALIRVSGAEVLDPTELTALREENAELKRQLAQRAAPSREMRTPIELESKYPGRCKHCGRRYRVGDTIQWQKGIGSWCSTHCYDQWEELQGVFD